VQLPEPLVDELLRLWARGCHRKVDVARPAHQVGGLSWAIVKRAAEMRVAWENSPGLIPSHRAGKRRDACIGA
jgi:hypothetical protein